MRFQRTALPRISRSILKALTDGGHIEMGSAREAERDILSVFTTYTEQVEKVGERARTLVQQRGLKQGEFGRIKHLAADQAGIKMGDDALDYLLDQLLHMLMHSDHIEEVFSEDHEMKRAMRPFITESGDGDARLEAAVRAKLKHVKEGSRVWEIEYARLKADLKRRGGN